MKVCPRCGYRTEDDEKVYCPKCGTKLEYVKGGASVIAYKSKVRGVASGDIMAYQSEVEGVSYAGGVKSQDVMAVRSKVAGGHIVEGNYVNINIINAVPSLDREYKEPKFYLVYMDENGLEKTLKVLDFVEIYRKKGSWDIVAFNGEEEIEIGIRDMGVSRKPRSVEIYMEGKKIYVKDNGVRNGVFVNGDRVNGVKEVKEGDIIVVGSVAFRVEKKINRISVKRDSLTPISEDIASLLPPEMVYYRNGRYYLNAMGMKAGNKMRIAGREIVVKESSLSESVKLNGSMMGDDLFIEMIRSALPRLDMRVREKMVKLLSLYEQADVGERSRIKEKIVELMGGNMNG